ncbi:MAG: methyltransferase domain-containing protein [Deltaproteobacteria bacterium]|nr:methyltransferase domain-containing protein [Deltaproteobacteria bacterium]
MLTPSLICPVRNCACRLELGPWGARCERGHCFDRARSGYVNLLQPQDRRSSTPGDSRAAVRARQRVLDGGLASVLRRVLLQAVGDCRGKMAGSEVSGLSSVLDVGCGCGYFLAAVCREFAAEGWGVDLSSAAVDAAARRYPDCRWLVVNADRSLPFADAGFDLLLTITSRKNPAEFRRVLRPGGRLIAVVSGEEDLAELRERILGEALAVDRVAGTVELFRGMFDLENEYLARDRLFLERPALADLLISSYRGARRRPQEKLARIDAMEVTLSHRLLMFRLAEGTTYK